MSTVETRYPCPVCLGVTLEKTPVKVPASFVLDHCTRCGGAWFDQGEVQKLRTGTPEQLWQHITRHDGVVSMQCHNCSQLIDRRVEVCPGCGWTVRLDCPICLRPMGATAYGGVTLDVCHFCHGVWVDHHELVELWRAEFSAAIVRRTGMAEAGAWVLADAVGDPFVLMYGADAAAHVVAAGVEAAPAMVEVATEAAGSVFEAIADFIAELFG